MAREESDREDLLREAVALVRRIELRVDGEPESVTAGYRRNGALSVFFGAEPVWQFNSAGELRRGYRDGKLLKASAGRLVEMTRDRTSGKTTLVSRDLDDSEQAAVLDEARRRLTALLAALDLGRHLVIGQVPPDADLSLVLRKSLRELLARLVVARSPHVGGCSR